MNVENTLDKALDAFWSEVEKRHPQAFNASTRTELELKAAARTAIAEALEPWDGE